MYNTLRSIVERQKEAETDANDHKEIQVFILGSLFLSL